MKKAFTLVEIMIVVAIIGIILSIAVPSFLRARETSRATACQGNLNQISGAKETWALENRSPGTSTPTWSSLIGATLYIKATPNCPGGGTYTLNNVQTDPACSVGSNSTNASWSHIIR